MASSTGIDNPAMESDRLDYEDETNKYKIREKQSDKDDKETNQPADGDRISSPQRTDDVDFNPLQIFKNLDPNSYATKKSLAQGLLDIGLIAANSAQLKYVLTAGPNHDFYTLLLTLIIASLSLQVIQVILCFILGLILDINKVDEQRKAEIINNAGVSIIVIVVVINIMITAFDVKAIDNQNVNNNNVENN